MTEESRIRQLDYLKSGCIVFGKTTKCTPLAFWTEKDIWDYIRKYNVPYSEIYNKGYTRSGCFQCLFGIQHEQEPNRIQMLSKTHPNLYKYCIDVLHYDKILKTLNVPYE